MPADKPARRGDGLFVLCCAVAFLVIVTCAAYFVANWLF